MPAVDPYDALLLVSFGGPEGPDDVLPFLRNVTAGKDIPPERLVEVGEHYFGFGGRSPINDQCRALIAALEAEIAARGLSLPVYWGNRNWDPYLPDAIAAMERDGVRRAVALTTSAYSSYSSCRQYRENLADALADSQLRVDMVRRYFHHPGFVDSFVEALDEALAGEAHVVFVTHSIPVTMEEASGAPGYVAQHRDVAASVIGRVAARRATDVEWSLAYCSRSGPPSVPWLEPDINDHLEALAARGVRRVALVPIGFVSDHMEVIYDLDTEARASAERLGIDMVRVATPGVARPFVTGLVDLVEERAARARGEDPDRPIVGAIGAYDDVCGPGCCANPRGPRRALGDAVEIR